ncbi:hypothetical protein [Demequina sp.]|uniref:hypothetical protein n=1 Tax=Demequina sp. TaxID=2050685 RepID=UPI003D10FBE9
MSAYRVAKIHIDALLTAATSLSFTDPGGHGGCMTFTHREIQYKVSGMGINELGAALTDLNNRAVNTRYREDIAPEPYAFERLDVGALSPVTILSLIAGLRYQCAEFDGWDTTLGAAFLDALERCAIKALPGYDEGPWTLDADNYAALRENYLTSIQRH